MTKSTWLLGVAFLAALIFAGCPNDPGTSSSGGGGGDTPATEHFTYSDAPANTVIDGLTEAGAIQTSLSIPANIVEVETGAFIANTVVSSLTFAGPATLVRGGALSSSAPLGPSLLRYFGNDVTPPQGEAAQVKASALIDGIEYELILFGGEDSAVALGIDETLGAFTPGPTLYFSAAVANSDDGKDYAVVGVAGSAFANEPAPGGTAVDAIEFRGSPPKVKFIGASAFKGMTHVATVDFGAAAGVEVMADAFKGTMIESFMTPAKDYTGLNSATSGVTGDYEHSGITKNGVPQGTTVTRYTGSGTATIDFSGLSNVTEIAAEAFKDSADIESVAFPSTLVRIGNNAFWGCAKLEAITFTSDVRLGEPQDMSGFTKFHAVSGLTGEPEVNDVFLGTKLEQIPALWAGTPAPSVTGTYSIDASDTDVESGNFKYDVFTAGSGSIAILKGLAATPDWDVDNDGTGFEETADAAAFTLPPTVDGGSVTGAALTAAARGLLYNTTELERIVFPAQPLVFGFGAFQKSGLGGAVAIPAGSELGAYAFAENPDVSAADFTAGESKTVSRFAFYATLASRDIGGDSLLSPGTFNQRFEPAKSAEGGITYAVLSDGLGVAAVDASAVNSGTLAIPDTALSGQPVTEVFAAAIPALGITALTIGANVKKFEGWVFGFGNTIATIDFGVGSSIEYLGENFAGPNYKGESIEFPASLKTVESRVFWEQTNVTSVILNSDVEVLSLGDPQQLAPTAWTYFESHNKADRSQMGSYAAFRKETLPSGTYSRVDADTGSTEMDDHTPAGGHTYRLFQYDDGGGNITREAAIMTGVDAPIDATVTASDGESYTVTTISAGAFEDVTFSSAADLTIPATLEFIDFEAFSPASGNGGLTSVTFSGVTYVANSVFEGSTMESSAGTALFESTPGQALN